MTDSEVIDLLGGTSKLSKALKTDPRRISNWRKRGISVWGKFRIRDLAKRKRIKLPDEFLESING